MSEKWIKARLGVIGEITKGSGISRDESNSGNLAAVRYGELYTHHDEYVKRYVSRISEKVARGAKLTKKGDVVFAGSGETPDDIGKCAALLDDGVYAGGDLVVVSPPTVESPIYWGCLLNMPYVQRQKASFAHGSSIYHLRPGEVARIEVVYANDVTTQRHIAEVLSTCDEVIEKSERAAEKYRQIKAGMLKDLLTRGIDNRGKLRPPPSAAPELYKDSELGPIPKEWEVKRLGDESVSVINPPACPLPSTFVYIDLESVKGGVLLQENLISREEAPSRAQRNVSVGDILYQLVRPYQMNNLLFRKSSALDYVASTGYALIRAAGDAGYLFQYVHTTEFVNKVLSMCTGTGYPAITPNNLSKILVRVPSLPEQRAIAARLAAVDERIAAEVKAAGKYRKVKAGLMEKLLTPPADAEIEDRTQEVAG